MKQEEYKKAMGAYPIDTVIVSYENGVLTVNCPGNVIFTADAAIQPILVEKVYVNFQIF